LGKKVRETLLQLFKQYSNDNLVTDKVPHILSKTFDKSCEVKIRSRRCSINRSTLEKESKNDWLTKIFQKACNRTKKAQVGNLYNLMAREPMLAVEAENFFSFFSFKLKTELSLPEFIKICKQIKVKKATIVRDTKSVIERRKSRTNTLNGKKNAKKEVILNIFDKYDINGDGVISISELKNGMRSFMSKETVQELFKEFDLDQSNTLDRDEFLRLFECTK
jgi:Ca2+-binding EF-hand superfamily protein